MNPEASPHPAAYYEGIRLFNEREYYDAHEAWEEHWQEIGDSSADFWKGLIQIAVALLHWERGNVHGARKLRRSGCGYLEPFAPVCLDLDVPAFLQTVAAYFAPLDRAVEESLPAPKPGPNAPQIRLR